MTKLLRCLFVEDSDDDTQIVLRHLRTTGYDVTWERVETAEMMSAALSRQPWDLIISDYSMPHFSGPAALEVSRASGLDLPFIIVSSAMGEAEAVAAMKAGANDYLIKGNLAHLGPAIERELRDATERRERKRAELALRESEAALTSAQRIARIGSWQWHLRSNTARWSSETFRIFGLNPGNLDNHRRNFVDCVLPADRERVDQALTDALSGARAYNLNYRIHLADGTVKIIHAEAEVVLGCDGQPDLLQGTVQDITEREQRDLELRESERKYRELVESANSIIMRWTPDGKITFINEYGLKLFGYSQAEMLGRTITATIIPPKDRTNQELGPLTDQICAHPEMFEQFVNENICRDGRPVWIAWTTKLIRDGQGKLEEVLSIGSDITELRDAEGTRRASERHFRLLTRAMFDAIITINSAERICGWNPGAERVFGYREDEACGKPVEMIIPSQYRDRHHRGVERLKQGGESHIIGKVIEMRGLHRDGHEFPLEMSLSEWQAPDGQYSSAIIRDITERKRTEDALRQEEALFSSLASAIPDRIYFKDRQSRFVRINASMMQRFGMHSPEEAIGRTDFNFYGTEHAKRAFDDEQQLMATGEPLLAIEEKEDWQDGHITWASSTKVPLRDADGKITGLVGISRDITERKLATEKMREQAELLNNVTDAIYVRSLDGVFSYWNDGAERLYGWKRSDVIGKTTAEVNWRDPAEITGIESALQTEGVWQGEQQQVTKTGQHVVVFSRASVVKNEAGKPASVFVINTDITEKKGIETRLLQAQRLESLGGLASGIAHDLNNVLAPILLATHILRGRARNESERRMIATVEASAMRGADIVRQVLSFGRGTQVAHVPLQPRHLLSEMTKIATETFPPNIQVEMDAPRNLWPVIGDATQMHQILMNLTINARDAMPDGGQLTLAAKNTILDEAFTAMTPGAKEGPHVILMVSDTGMGIAPENQGRVFEPFFTTKEVGKGTGLGLPTVLILAKSHGGFVRFHSTVGRGTCFEVFLPAAPDVKPASLPDASSKLPRGKGEMILMVDDEVVIRTIVAKILKKNGYKVVSAADGSEALGLFMSNRTEIAVVVTDMLMPNLDGPALVRVLRHIDPKVRLIGISGVGEPVSLNTVKSLALSGFLTKPFTAEKLLNALHDVLHAQPATEGDGSVVRA